MMREAVTSILFRLGHGSHGYDALKEKVVTTWLQRLKTTGGGGANAELADAHEAAWIASQSSPNLRQRHTFVSTCPPDLSLGASEDEMGLTPMERVNFVTGQCVMQQVALSHYGENKQDGHYASSRIISKGHHSRRGHSSTAICIT